MSELPEYDPSPTDSVCPVPAEYVAGWKGLYNIFQEELGATLLEELECVTLQFMYSIESKRVTVGDDQSGKFLKLMLAKISQELWGLIGSLRYASFYSSYHHARSVLELYAGLSYVYNKPSKTSKRLRKFFEFEDVYKLNMFNSLEAELKAGKIDQAEFESAIPISVENAEKLREQVDGWVKLYRPKDGDLAKIKHWHESASVLTLFESTGAFEQLWHLYGFLSHGTHFSPFGYNLAGGYLLFGYPRTTEGIVVDAVDKPIKAALISVHLIDILLQEKLDMDMQLEFRTSPSEWV